MHTVTDHEPVSPTDFPPLYDAVPLDLLASVVTHLSPVRVTFAYASYQVTVESDGSVPLVE